MADQQWTVVRDRHNHWGMVEVEGPALTVRGFTVATDVDAVHARKVEEDAYKIAAAPELYEALDRLEVSANTVAYCYSKRPENFAQAFQQLRDDAGAARAALAKARGEQS